LVKDKIKVFDCKIFLKDFFEGRRVRRYIFNGFMFQVSEFQSSRVSEFHVSEFQGFRFQSFRCRVYRTTGEISGILGYLV